MDRYVIECSLPNAGSLTAEELREIPCKYKAISDEMGEDIRWVESHVTGDTLYCVYDATDPALIREHTRRGPFPCSTGSTGPSGSTDSSGSAGSTGSTGSSGLASMSSDSGSVPPATTFTAGLGEFISALWAVRLGKTIAAAVLGWCAAFWFRLVSVLRGLSATGTPFTPRRARPSRSR